MAVGVVVVVVSWLAASCGTALALAGAVRLADARAPEGPHAPELAPVRLPLPRTSVTEQQPQEPEHLLAAAAVSRPRA